MQFQNAPIWSSVLVPVLALVVWSLILWIWMYARRLPAMSKAKLDPQAARFPGSLNVLPDGARQVADNYNHLMEQPTIFYAMAIFTYLAGGQDGFTAGLAWGYVALRIVHSLIQTTVNLVPLRFLVFALSTVVLMVWAGCEVLQIVGG